MYFLLYLCFLWEPQLCTLTGSCSMLNNVAVIFFFFCFTVSVKNISCVCQSGLAISSLLLATLCCGIYTTKMFEKPQKAGMLDHVLSVMQACKTTCFFIGPKSIQKHKKAKPLGININLELSKDSVLHTWLTIFCFMTVVLPSNS